MLYSDNATKYYIMFNDTIRNDTIYDMQRYYSDNVAIKIDMQQCYSDNAAKYYITFFVCIQVNCAGRSGRV